MVPPSLYDFPDIYDIILRAPLEQIETEVNSICRLLADQGITKGRILELACGTCTHAIKLAQRGFSVTGLDLSPAMLAGTKQRAARAGVSIDLFRENLIDFDLHTASFDGVIFMAETFPLLTEYDDMVSHFNSVRRHLKRSGLYVIDIDAHQHGVGTKYGVWGEKTIPIEGGQVEIWHEDFPGDWVQGTSHVVMHCRIHQGNVVHETVDEWKFRVDSPWHLSVLMKTLAGWSLRGFYSWRDLSQDISEERHYFMVVEGI